MKRIVFFIVILFFAKFSFASDTIIVHKDARLDVLTQKQIQMNKLAAMLTSNGLYKGFRVQIISTSNREEAFKMKADVLTKFPDQKSYIIFQAPNYKIRIGNFLKREDAENYRKQITNSFPQEIYVVEDAIEYTPKGNEEISQ